MNIKMNFSHALKGLYGPEFEYTINDEYDYKTLFWHERNTVPKPTKAKLVAWFKDDTGLKKLIDMNTMAGLDWEIIKLSARTIEDAAIASGYVSPAMQKIIDQKNKIISGRKQKMAVVK